jgi:hypothetical protein
MILDNTPSIHVVVAPERWNYIGYVTREGEWLVIRQCYNIRRWGTTAGLGQLCLTGPTEATVLDKFGVTRVHYLQATCHEATWDGWAKRLK